MGTRDDAGTVLPAPLQRPLERFARRFLQPEGSPPVDFAQPVGEPALLPPDSVSWQVFKNPVALAVGGIAAVILELAEPRVRTGVWEHTSFRTHPVPRLQRTGLAAMVTVYGAASTARAMIAGVRRRHDGVQGLTPEGRPYHANDPELLTWVQATAAFGFLQAYHVYARPLSAQERDAFYAEAAVSGRLYGAEHPPPSEAALLALLEATRPRLVPSPILDEFLGIMRHAPLLPVPLRPIQGLLVKGAVDLLPAWARDDLVRDPRWRLSPTQQRLLQQAGTWADRLVLRDSPAVQACRRLGLDDRYLHQGSLRPRS